MLTGVLAATQKAATPKGNQTFMHIEVSWLCPKAATPNLLKYSSLSADSLTSMGGGSASLYPPGEI